MRELLPLHRPALVLAPMQDITDLPFMRVLSRRSAPDWFVTEYFRVHPDSRLDRYILRSIIENETQRPIFAQMIGSDVSCLKRAATELAQYPVAGIDLNLGCPAPIVCRKNAGGGLLRDPSSLFEMLKSLRDTIDGKFTVKTRIGYHHPDEFALLIEGIQSIGIDGLTIHGRTVQERYLTPVHPEAIRHAVEVMNCPVIANGNAVDTQTAVSLLNQTQAAGIMIGRGAIRNPWIFAQIHAHYTQAKPPAPTYHDLWTYVLELYEEIAKETKNLIPNAHVQRMKKTLAYISHGLDGPFEFEMRRANTPDDFFRICQTHLDHPSPLPALPPHTSKLFCGFQELLS